MNEKKTGLRKRRPELELSSPTPTPHHHSVAVKLFFLLGLCFQVYKIAIIMPSPSTL